jgi:hypothetical protein
LAKTFTDCENLIRIRLPKELIHIGQSAFMHCSSLTTASFSKSPYIAASAFVGCSRLISLYLMGSTVCVLGNSRAFSSTPIGGYTSIAGRTGSIFVPTSLVASYKAATNWTYFSNRIFGI